VSDSPHPIDLHVGKRIRHRRWLIGVTQQVLADSVGVKFQQIQKYEIGSNRVSASRLWNIAQTLGVPVAFFFEGVENTDPAIDVFLTDKEAVMMLQAYYKMPIGTRKHMMKMARELATIQRPATKTET